MTGEDDPTPATPPCHPDNRGALSQMADLCFLADTYLRALREMSRELRRLPRPAPDVWREQLARRVHEFHDAAGKAAAGLLTR